jgi:hypothetical protein
MGALDPGGSSSAGMVYNLAIDPAAGVFEDRAR